MASNSSTLVKCPPKNTGLLLSELFKDHLIVPYKAGRSLKKDEFEQNFQNGYYAWIGVLHPIFITEEFQWAGTAKMNMPREALHSGLLSPLSVRLRKDVADMIQK